MIYDNIANIETYKGISPDIYEGLKYLQQVSPDVEIGVHELSPRVKAIVSEYKTMAINEYGYEAHKKYIDIQYLLKGSEKVCCLPIEQLKEAKPYSDEKDAAFYTTNNNPTELTLGNGYFAIFYPQDGHMPQLCVDEPLEVKKVVLKVEVGECWVCKSGSKEPSL